MLESIVSGGQTGADRGGWMPRSSWGSRTGAGSPRGDAPRTARSHAIQAQENGGSSYPERNEEDVLDSMAQPSSTLERSAVGALLPPTSPSNEASLASTSI